jgi:hypothetical protein
MQEKVGATTKRLLKKSSAIVGNYGRWPGERSHRCHPNTTLQYHNNKKLMIVKKRLRAPVNTCRKIGHTQNYSNLDQKALGGTSKISE